jgi:hypothetical protein
MKLRTFSFYVAFLSVPLATTPARADCNSASPCLSHTNSGAGSGLFGAAKGSTSGVNGQSVTGTGVVGGSQTGTGVAGLSASSGIGVYGSSSSNNGVWGTSTSMNGVFGKSQSTGASGVYGESSASGGIGAAGRSWSSGIAVYGDNADGAGWAGYFDGRLYASSAFKPGGGSWTDSSDARLKKEVKELEGVLDRVLKLRGVTFKWIDAAKHGNLEGPQIGMIAQEVEKVFPEWVGMDSDGYRTLTFRGFEALAVESMRTLHNDNQALRVQVTSLEDRIKKLENGRPSLMAGFGPGSLATVGAVALALGVVLTSRWRPSS